MRDPKTESYLNDGQWKWKFAENVSFNLIDIAASEENPARIFRKLDQDVALRYGLAMEAGKKFPAMVLLNHEKPNGKAQWIIATGVHRYFGAQSASIHSFDAYLVTEADPFRRDHLIRSLNRLEGKGMTQHEIIQHILAEHETFPNQSLTQLARDWNQRPQTILNASKERESRIRARRMGYDFDRQRVNPTASLALSSIQNDKVFDKAAEFVAYTANVGTNDIKDMISEIRGARDEQSQLAVVAKHKELADNKARAQRAQHGKTRPVAITNVIRNIKALNNQFSRPLAELHVAVLEDNISEQIFLAQRLKENLNRYILELERASRMSHPPTPPQPQASRR